MSKDVKIAFAISGFLFFVSLSLPAIGYWLNIRSNENNARQGFTISEDDTGFGLVVIGWIAFVLAFTVSSTAFFFWLKNRK